MKHYSVTNCPVIWKCHRLDEEFTVDSDALYNLKDGWLCKCGEFVKKGSRSHEIISMGLREGVKREKNDKIMFFLNPRVDCVCCECGNPTDRSINDVFICEECYYYDYDEIYGYKTYIPDDFVTALGLMILNCSIEFNPDILICKNCKVFYDCSVYHVLMDLPKVSKNDSLANF